MNSDAPDGLGKRQGLPKLREILRRPRGESEVETTMNIVGLI